MGRTNYSVENNAWSWSFRRNLDSPKRPYCFDISRYSISHSSITIWITSSINILIHSFFNLLKVLRVSIPQLLYNQQNFLLRPKVLKSATVFVILLVFELIIYNTLLRDNSAWASIVDLYHKLNIIENYKLKNRAIKLRLDFCRQGLIENHLCYVRSLISTPLWRKISQCDCDFYSVLPQTSKFSSRQQNPRWNWALNQKGRRRAQFYCATQFTRFWRLCSNMRFLCSSSSLLFRFFFETMTNAFFHVSEMSACSQIANMNSPGGSW